MGHWWDIEPQKSATGDNKAEQLYTYNYMKFIVVVRADLLQVIEAARLKIWLRKLSVGSSPTLGTTIKSKACIDAGLCRFWGRKIQVEAM